LPGLGGEPDLAHIVNDRNKGAGNTDINGKALALKIREKEAAGPRDGAGNRNFRWRLEFIH
jgi:hypothetical protein